MLKHHVFRNGILRRFLLARVLLAGVFIAVFSTAAASQGVQTKPDADVPSTDGALVAEIYLARDDGSGKAGDAATAFRVTDVPIYCVVNLNTNEPTTVRMNLVATDVQGVKPGTRVVTTTYITKDRQNRVNFTGRPEGNWVAGKYRADIYVKDKLVWSKDFVIGSGAAVPAKPPVKPVVARGRRA